MFVCFFLTLDLTFGANKRSYRSDCKPNWSSHGKGQNMTSTHTNTVSRLLRWTGVRLGQREKWKEDKQGGKNVRRKSVFRWDSGGGGESIWDRKKEKV